jgi:hypothetical protein
MPFVRCIHKASRTRAETRPAIRLKWRTPVTTGPKSASPSPHADSGGFNIELNPFPRDGRLVVLPPQSSERDDKSPEVKGAVAEAVRASKPGAAKERTR